MVIETPVWRAFGLALCREGDQRFSDILGNDIQLNGTNGTSWQSYVYTSSRESSVSPTRNVLRYVTH